LATAFVFNSFRLIQRRASLILSWLDVGTLINHFHHHL